MAHKAICDQYGKVPARALMGVPLLGAGVAAAFNPLSMGASVLLGASGLAGWSVAVIAEKWAKHHARQTRLGMRRSNRFIQRMQLGAAFMTTGPLLGAAYLIEQQDHRAPSFSQLSGSVHVAPAEAASRRVFVPKAKQSTP